MPDSLFEMRKEFAHAHYDGMCFVCQKKFGKRFQFHHKRYIKGDKKWHEFTNPMDYWKHVEEKMLEDPDRFTLLCHTCHHRVDKQRGGLSRMNKDKLERLFIVSRETIKEKSVRKKK